MGTETAQRWSVELLHGHGGQVGQQALLCANRETGAMTAGQVVQAQQVGRPAVRAIRA